MYAVACCVRNRLNAGLSLGLSSADRKDLNRFVKKQGKDIEAGAKYVVESVFDYDSEDITNGALYFESTDFPKSIRQFDRKYRRLCQIGKHVFYTNRVRSR
jgi:hypothetical protein